MIDLIVIVINFIKALFGPSPPLILKSLNSLELSVSHDQIDRYMVLHIRSQEMRIEP